MLAKNFQNQILKFQDKNNGKKKTNKRKVSNQMPSESN